MRSSRVVRKLAMAAALALLPAPAAAQPAQLPPAAEEEPPATEAGHLARIAAFERDGPPADPAYLDALAGLGLFYFNQGRHADALPVLRRAVAASERIHGPEHALTQEIRATLQLLEGFLNRP